MGYVYMIGPAEPVAPYRVKIGKADDVNARLKGLQTGSLVTLKIMWTVEHPEPHKLERQLHDNFADRRTHGEWFDLGANPIAVIMDQMPRIDNPPPQSRGARIESAPVRDVLYDIRTVWPGNQDRVGSQELVGRLRALQGAPWGKEWAPLTGSRELALMLRTAGIKPKKIRIPGRAEVVQGYVRSDFPFN